MVILGAENALLILLLLQRLKSDVMVTQPNTHLIPVVLPK